MSTGFILLDTPNPNYPQCRRTRRNGARPTGTCVVHTAENFVDLIGEDSGAETVARFIATRSTPGSYHFLCDSDSLIFMAPASYETWHDTATNNFSYGGSMAVRAGEWHRIPKERRERIVKNCAAGFASYAEWLKETYGITIPAKRITRAQAHRGEPGLLGHGDSDPGRRTDPGAAFDWDLFLDEFARLTGQGGSKPTVKPAGKPTPSKPATSSGQPTDYADLAVDGKLGPKTISALQIVMRAIGTYSRAVDGDFGRHTVIAVQRWLRSRGFYKRAIDGHFGKHTAMALQRFLRSKGLYPAARWLIDGDLGPATVRALQTYLNRNNGR
ncbi:hypothetical protein BJH93_04180 [Kocuria polaris]|nr:hypothetical protein [Kocuria polaris]